MMQQYAPPSYMRPYPEGSIARPRGIYGFFPEPAYPTASGFRGHRAQTPEPAYPPASTSYAEDIFDAIHRDKLRRDEDDFYFMTAPNLGPSNHLPMSGGPMYRLPEEPKTGGMPLDNPYQKQLQRSGPEDAPKRTKKGKTAKAAKDDEDGEIAEVAEDDPYSRLPHDPYFKQLLKAIELEQSGQGDLGIGRETVPRTTGLAPGTGMSDYHQRNIDRLRNLSADMVGAHAYRDAMSGRRPAYEVTGDMSVSPYWRNRTYNETPTKTAQQRREQQSRYLSDYGGHQGRKNFDTLDPEDPKAQAYMARKFREAGVKEPTDYSESAYQDALDAKADAYNERRKKRRQRVADNIGKQGRPQTGTERNRNRQRFGMVPTERGQQAQRAEQRRRLMAEMFGNYRGY